MNAKALSYFPMTWLSCVGLLIFFVVFVAIFLRVYLKSNIEIYKKLASLPLAEEGESHE